MRNPLVAHPVIVGHGSVVHVAPIVLVTLTGDGLRIVVGEAASEEGPKCAVVYLVHGTLARSWLVVRADLGRKELFLPIFKTDTKPFWRHEVWGRAPVV